MKRSTLLTPILIVTLTGALIFTTGCDSTPVAPDGPAEAKVENPARAEALVLSAATSEVHKELAALRRATARYHRVEVAVEDGFVQAAPCADPPNPGAIGIPYVKLDRIDMIINLEEPEVLFYESQKNGRLRLVGAEPVVPIEAWDEVHDEPPSLFGHEFHRNEEVGLYGLHMWVWLHNPEGIFAFTHPKVSCEFAE